ncbi:hypothetical protein NE236_10555 [Actinoallomurus purpureus]|uniref:D-alanyl-D-alanine carboxypeptidase family protein n=1 Tax=Actinoallomurus purpureus TaxID=478114 RepID=UPI0020937867|nr:hypothetical protein [Actinoallomurus purpureus]MCO6005422.1 hypothetical protein [Actinoallomurus purpureus]
MDGASHELDDDAQRETSGTPPQDDPEPGAAPQVETGTRAEDPTDADSDAQVQPASDQEDSSGPDTEPEAATAGEAEAEPERPSEATGSEEEDETAAEAEDEQEEDEEQRPETSSESPEADEADGDGDGDGDEGVIPEDAAPEDTVTSEDTAAPEDAAASEDTAASEHAAAAEDTHASEDTADPDGARPEQADEPEQPEPEPEPEDEPGPGEEVKGGQEDGRTVTAEFRLPPRPQPSAASDHDTVSDLPRAAFPPARTADTKFTPTAPHHPPSTEEPRPTRSAPEPAPWPGTRGADRKPEADTIAPPHNTVADLPITRPAPDRGAFEPATDAPRWQERTPGPSAYAYPTAPPTVEEALPDLRSFTREDFAGTAQMDGLLTTDPPAAYTAPPPQMTPPPFSATPPPGAVQPPVTEASAPAEEPRRKRRRTGRVIVVVALVLLAGLVTGQFVRPTPRPTLRLTLPTAQHTFDGAAPVLPWPVQGQATLYVEGVGTMGASGGQAPTPTASVAKVMTAYVFLRDHPLQPGAQGPTFRISPQEAARLPARKQRGESFVEVVAGQAFTQRKALEALMIVSANNVAHELARWDSGGEQAFVQKMNAAARSLGMTDTVYTDPSGFDSRTVSTAADQVKLLTAAMKIPAFAEIVRNRTYVPNDGRPPRSGGDVLVGRHGVVGGKTGYTDAAGGNFVFAAHKRTGGVTTTIVGAVMGQQSASAMGAITVAQRLVIAAEKALASVTLAQAGARVAVVDDGLGGRTPLRAAAPVTVVGWGGLTVPVRVTGDPRRHAAGGTRLGAVTAGSAVTPLTLDRELKEPSILRRLLRRA